MAESTSSSPRIQDLVITRVFDAPRELVFKAWTEPEHFTQWWGPNGYSTPHCTLDARPGGDMFFCMRSAEGDDTWARGTFLEVVPPEKIVYTEGFADPEGNIIDPASIGLPADFPELSRVEVTFTDLGGKTEMTLRHAMHIEIADDARRGWSESFDRLETYVESNASAS